MKSAVFLGEIVLINHFFRIWNDIRNFCKGHVMGMLSFTSHANGYFLFYITSKSNEKSTNSGGTARILLHIKIQGVAHYKDIFVSRYKWTCVSGDKITYYYRVRRTVTCGYSEFCISNWNGKVFGSELLNPNYFIVPTSIDNLTMGEKKIIFLTEYVDIDGFPCIWKIFIGSCANVIPSVIFIYLNFFVDFLISKNCRAVALFCPHNFWFWEPRSLAR